MKKRINFSFACRENFWRTDIFSELKKDNIGALCYGQKKYGVIGDYKIYECQKGGTKMFQIIN